MKTHHPSTAGQVNINTASVATLRDEIKGIGQVLAERIVAYREANGPFKSVSELENVYGIGSVLLSRVADQLTVGEQEHVASELILSAADQVSHLPTGTGEPISVASVERPSIGPEEDREMVDADDRPVPEEEAQASQGEGGIAESASEQWASLEQGDLSDAEVEADTELEQQPALAEDGGAYAVSEKEPAPVLQELPPLSEEEPIAVQQAEPALAVAASVAGAHLEQALPVAEPITDTDKPKEEEPASLPPVAAPATMESAKASRYSFWHDFRLVVLGGALGFALTLVFFAFLSGTVNYATRREFDMLSRNTDIMQSNFQVAWDRMNNLEQRTDTMQNEIVPLAPLPGRVDTLERSVDKTRDTLGEVESDVQVLTSQMDTLQSSVADMEQQVGGLTKDMVALRTSLDELQNAFEVVQERVTRFDTFFAALRDLLMGLSPAEGATMPKTSAAPTATTQPE